MRGPLLILALAGALLCSPAGSAEPDRSALELYGLRLLQTGSRLRSYPQEAVRDQLSGTAVVELSLDAQGRLERQRLVRSSGHATLDSHALAMLARAVPETEIPTTLGNTAFTIQVAVVFALP